MKVLFACTGTGGHLFPAVIVARGLRKRVEDIDVLFCISDDGKSTEFLEREGLPWVTVPSRPFPGLGGGGSLRFPATIFRGLAHSLTVLKRFHPDVVVGTGGYVSGPVLLAAWLKGIPVIIQEQNNSPGLTNRILAPLVDEIHVSFPDAAHFPCTRRKKVFLTGNPVALNDNGDGGITVVRREAPGDPPVVLILGGSQGAHAINRIMVQCLRSLDPLPYKVFFQTGRRDYSWVSASLADRSPQVVVEAFFGSLSDIYRGIDLAICRAGAMTLTEMAFWGIPSILIPYPHAKGGHQEKNALYYSMKKAAIVLRERETDWRTLRNHLERVLGDRELWNKMSRAAFALRRPAARDVLVDRIISLGR